MKTKRLLYLIFGVLVLLVVLLSLFSVTSWVLTLIRGAVGFVPNTFPSQSVILFSGLLALCIFSIVGFELVKAGLKKEKD